jgi:hypothetical protein
MTKDYIKRVGGHSKTRNKTLGYNQKCNKEKYSVTNLKCNSLAMCESAGIILDDTPLWPGVHEV